MEIAPHLLTPTILTLALWFGAATLLFVLWQAPWRALLAVSARQHLFFVVMFALLVLWLASFRPTYGLSLHLLGMTTATLLLGGALASLAGLLALCGLVLIERATWPGLPLAWLLGVIVPALTTALLLRALAYFGFRNLFVFMLGLGFAGAMVSVLVVAAAGLLILAAAGQQALVATAFEHVSMLPLLLFPEGFINGAMLSAITVYFPHLVRGFDEDRFLGRG